MEDEIYDFFVRLGLIAVILICAVLAVLALYCVFILISAVFGGIGA